MPLANPIKQFLANRGNGKTPVPEPIDRILDTILHYAAVDRAQAIQIELLHNTETLIIPFGTGRHEISPDGDYKFIDPDGNVHVQTEKGMFCNGELEWKADPADGPVALRSKGIVLYHVANGLSLFLRIPEYALQSLIAAIKRRAKLDPQQTGTEQAGEFNFDQVDLRSHWHVHVIPTEFDDEKIMIELV